MNNTSGTPLSPTPLANAAGIPSVAHVKPLRVPFPPIHAAEHPNLHAFDSRLRFGRLQPNRGSNNPAAQPFREHARGRHFG